MHGLVFSYDVTFFLGQSTSILQNFVSGEIPEPLLRHKTFHFKLILKPSILLPRDSPFLSFNFPILCLFGTDNTVFEDLNSFLHFTMPFCTYVFRLQQFINLGPILCLALPALPAPNQNFTLPLHSSYQQIVATQIIFPKRLTSTSALYIFLASSCTYCLVRISSIDTCWPPHTIPFDALCSSPLASA